MEIYACHSKGLKTYGHVIFQFVFSLFCFFFLNQFVICKTHMMAVKGKVLVILMKRRNYGQYFTNYSQSTYHEDTINCSDGLQNQF